MTPRSEQIGALARDALAREARLTPKPGLVDAQNSGAHSDMDLPLLLGSADALEPYFVRFAARGAADAALPPNGRLAAIRADGVAAEAAMLAATNGVNTHKGALFLLGALCYAAGHRAENGALLTPRMLCQTAARVCEGVTAELRAGGGRAYARYGARGARGEAEDGFPNALAAMDAYAAARSLGANEEDGWRIALLALIAAVEDANVLARCGEATAEALRRRAGEIAAAFPSGGRALEEALEELDAQCRIWRASPGGAADLLACAMFLHALTAQSA